ncbi:MAG: fasciclin domain-containing protein [Planctomycetota bacterium]
MKNTSTAVVALIAGLAGTASAQCSGSTHKESGATLSLVSARAEHAPDLVDTARRAGQFSTLLAAAEAAGLVPALQGHRELTVFAPTDEAFSKLPAGTVETLLKPENKDLLTAVLTYHIVEGKVAAADVVKVSTATTLGGQRLDITTDNGVQIDNANVIKTDITASNGIIHVIDTVLMPSTDDIVATAAGAGSFSTLVTAVKAAGLVEALQADGPLTVFAPTDDAFADLPAGTVESLLKPANREKLQAILTYHVVSGRVYSDAALAAQSAHTLQGGDIRISLRNGRLTINDATVISSDIDTANGVIHVIDGVLLPE